MENGKQEVITAKTIEDKQYTMRHLSYFCKKNILLCCKNCNRILTTNSIIEKILRLTNGKICFIIGDDDENSELMIKFKSNLIIQSELKVNNNSEFKTVGLNEITCKYCKNSLGVRIRQTDDTQIFMLNKIVLKLDALKFFSIDENGLRPYHFHYKPENIKSMDKYATEIDQYIQKSGYHIQKFFDILSSQNNDFQEIENRKMNIDKLGDILKYLIDKNYI